MIKKNLTIINKLEDILIACSKQNCNICDLKNSSDCLKAQLNYIKQIKENIKNGNI